MKILFFPAVALTALSQHCERSQSSEKIPRCISEITERLQQEGGIWQYHYNGRRVFYVKEPCCDRFNTLYDESCRVICHPDGGITGKGDSRCPDFFEKRKEEKRIWEAQHNEK